MALAAFSDFRICLSVARMSGATSGIAADPTQHAMIEEKRPLPCEAGKDACTLSMCGRRQSRPGEFVDDVDAEPDKRERQQGHPERRAAIEPGQSHRGDDQNGWN